MENNVGEFTTDIARVVNYISRGYEIRARAIFNELQDTYSHLIQPNTDLYFAVEIWVLLNEYLNAETMGEDFSDKKTFLLSAYEDFLADKKGLLS